MIRTRLGGEVNVQKRDSVPGSRENEEIRKKYLLI
jgi:hypothetical protein